MMERLPVSMPVPHVTEQLDHGPHGVTVQFTLGPGGGRGPAHASVQLSAIDQTWPIGSITKHDKCVIFIIVEAVIYMSRYAAMIEPGGVGAGGGGAADITVSANDEARCCFECCMNKHRTWWRRGSLAEQNIRACLGARETNTSPSYTSHIITHHHTTHHTSSHNTPPPDTKAHDAARRTPSHDTPPHSEAHAAYLFWRDFSCQCIVNVAAEQHHQPVTLGLKFAQLGAQIVQQHLQFSLGDIHNA